LAGQYRRRAPKYRSRSGKMCRMTEGQADLVAAYWMHARMSTSEVRGERLAAAEWEWAYAEVVDVVSAADEPALDLLDALLRSEDGTPEQVGAGPLEHLLAEHGPRVAEAVADRARMDPLWRRAVAACWLDQDQVSRLSPLAPFLGRGGSAR
jgi:hypothetical protein